MEGYRFQFPLKVAISDINYGGHVANSKILDYFQEARIAYLAEMGDFSELDVGGPGLILPEAHVKYLAEMFLGDQLVIGVHISRLSRSSLTMEYRIERDGQGTAEGTTAIVCFDYEKRKPRRLDSGFRGAVETFEGEGLST